MSKQISENKHTKSDDTQHRAAPVFALAPEIELAIGKLPSVRDVRVIIEGQAIDEIHVLSEPAVQPKRLVRDIVTLLLVRFGVRIDHRCISIVESEQQIAATRSRPILQAVTHDSATQSVRVELRFADHVICGDSPLCADTSDVLAASIATTNALKQLIGGRGELSVCDARTLTLADQQLVIVLVQWHGDQTQDMLVGTGLIEHDCLLAAARATLDALNRRLIRVALSAAQ